MNRKHLILSAIGAAVILLVAVPGFANSVLGTADSFAVLAGSTVTNTGPTTITGNLGVSPGLAVTGFPPGLVAGGTIHAGDAVAIQAQSDLTTAYNVLAGMTVTSTLTGQDLGGLTLTPGVYKYDSSAQLTGTLTLDAQGNNNASWVFQIGSTLTTASSSVVNVINLGSNDGKDDGLFWQVGSSATLGTTTTFEGNIVALTSITLDTGATILNGRALARNGAVTLDTNDISNVCPNGGPGYNGVPLAAVPEPLTLGGVALGLVTLCGYIRRRKCAACGS